MLKYVTEVNNTLLSEKIDRKLVLSLALMWIFRKRAFSVSKDFGLFLVEEKVNRPHGPVDLEGKTIYHWVLVGFWSGDFGRWTKDLSFNEFWVIYSSECFSKSLFSD